MVSIMNDYVNKIHLITDDVSKAILNAALNNNDTIKSYNILVKANRYIVNIKLHAYSMESAVAVMNEFMENSRYHYSAFFLRYNEGELIRYRYASCKENRDGFYCDVIIN